VLHRGPVVVRDAIGDLPSSVVHSGETTVYPALPKNASQFLKKMRLDAFGGSYTKAIKKKRAIGKDDPVILHNHHTKEMRGSARTSSAS
jgi:DNA (cytosine-5)-methyltransferase 1